MAILAVNNLRDCDQDKLANKKTLAVRFGKKFVRMEYVVSVVLAVFIGMTESIYMIFSLIPAYFVMKIVLNHEGRILNDALAATGKVLVFYTILFSVLCLM
jgi:1,4-dihydroxy-2-naphthoate octaprenyltransferase